MAYCSFLFTELRRRSRNEKFIRNVASRPQNFLKAISVRAAGAFSLVKVP